MSLHFNITANNSNFNRKIREVRQGINDTTQMIKSSGYTIDSIYERITKSAAALGGAFALEEMARQLYNFSVQYDKSMREVSTISKTVSEDLDGAKDAMLDLTTDVPIAADEAAKALYQIISAGYDGAEGMKVLEVSAKAAIGGVTDSATAADAITTLLNAYKMSADDAESVSDKLFTTVKLGKTTMGELGQSIAQAAPIAASYGVEIDQVLAATATLTKSGTPTAQAMTQVRAALISSTKVLGDGYYATHTFQEGLSAISAMAGGSESKLRALVPEVEGMNAVLGLTGINAKTAASDLEQLNDSAGATEVAFTKMLENPDVKLQLLCNNALKYFSGLGEGIMNSVGSIAGYINEAFESGDIERYTEAVMVLVAGYGLYKGKVIGAIAVQKLQNIVIKEAILQKKSAAAAGITLSNAEALAAARTSLLSAAHFKLVSALKAVKLAMINNPYTAALVGITAVVAAIVLFRDRTEETTEAVKSANSEINNQKALVDSLQSTLNNNNVSLTARKKALQDLKEIVPGYNASLTEEGKLIDNNTDAISRYLIQFEKQVMMKAAQSDLEEAYKAKRKASQEIEEKIAKGYSNTDNQAVGWGSATYTHMQYSEEEADKMRKEYLKEYDDNIKKLNNEIAARSKDVETSEDSTTPANYGADYKKAQKEWEDAKKALEDIEKDKNNFTREAYEKAKSIQEEKKKAFQELGGVVSTSGSSPKSSNDDRLRQEKQIASELLSLKKSNEQAVIDQMKDGSEKRLAQINLDYENEIAAIKAMEAKWREAQGGKLTDSQSSEISKAKQSANSKRGGAAFEVAASEIIAEEEAYNKRLVNFQSFQERYQKLEEEHKSNLQIISQRGGDQADIDSENQSYENNLQSLNDEVLATIGEFESLGVEATDNVINEMIAKLEKAKSDLESSGSAGNATKIKAINAELARCKKLKEENNKTSQGRSLKEWQDMEEQLKNCSSSLQEVGNEIGGVVGESISAAGEIAGSLTSMVSGIVMLVENGVTGMTAAGKAGAAALKAVETASVILAVIGAVISLVKKLYDLIEGNKQKALQEEIDMYNELVTTYDTLIDKQKELLKNSEQSKALAEYNKGLDMAKEKTDAAKKSLETWLSGTETRYTGSLSWAWKSRESWFEQDFGDILDKDQLFSMDAEAWDNWRDENTKMWTQLPDEVKKYAEAIMEAKIQTDELNAAWYEYTTGFSVDGLKSDLLDMLNDFDTTAEDVAENFTDYFTQAINKVVANELDEDLVKWYENLAKAMEGGLTKDERKALENEYKGIVKEGQDKRDAAYELTGYKPEESVSSQSSNSTGFNTMDQDTGNELNGRFAAFQISNEDIANSMKSAVAGMSLLAQLGGESNIILSDIRTQIAFSNGYLEDMTEVIKELKGVKAIFTDIKTNTDKL